MKKSTRIFSAVLAGLLLMSAVSCSGGTDSKETSKETAGGQTSGETTAETEEETKKYLDDIPDNVKFDGDTVSFLASFTSSSIALLDNDDATEVVNDAVYNRNLIIGERLGVNIEIARGATTGYGEFNSVVTNAVAAGTEEFDVLCGHTRFNINLASQGILKNLDNINYIDLSKEYWSQGYDNNISYDNIHYWATGDLSVEYIGYIYAMFVNSAMWNDHYSDTDIYSVVKEGKWTLDKLAEYAENVYVDVNGNGEVDNDDSFGVVMQKGHVLNGMAFAANVVYTSYDENGTPYISVNNEHTIDVFNKLHSLFYSSTGARMLENGEFDGLTEVMFPARRLLFCPNQFQFAGNEKIREMEDNFYIIPMPKYDENQENYRSNQYDGVPIYGVPITVKESKLDTIGATLEAMCSLSSQSVIPVYYDKVLKNKYSRDAQTAEMIDLIHDSVTSDFCFAWGDTIGSMYNIFYDNIQNESIESRLKSLEKPWGITMKRLLAKLDEYSGN